MSKHELSPRQNEWVLQRQKDIAAALLRDMVYGLSHTTRGLDLTHSQPITLDRATVLQIQALSSLQLTGGEIYKSITHPGVTIDHFQMGSRLTEYGQALQAVDRNKHVSLLDICNAMLLFGAQTTEEREIVPITLTLDSRGTQPDVVIHPFLHEVPLRSQPVDKRTLFVPELPWTVINEALAQTAEVIEYHKRSSQGPIYEPPEAIVQISLRRQEEKPPEEETNEVKAAQLLLAIRPVIDRLLRQDNLTHHTFQTDPGYVWFYANSPKVGFICSELSEKEIIDLEQLFTTYYTLEVDTMNNTTEVNLSLNPEAATLHVLRKVQELDTQYALMKPFALRTGNSPLTNALSNGYSLVNRMNHLRIMVNRKMRTLRALIDLNTGFDNAIFSS